MKVLGLITEYNPFHNGHLHHLKESKKMTGADYTIAVMSGHFMQRGEPAIIDKWSRATMAVKSGVDLVLELTGIYACASAEYFARGGILLLDQLGCVSDFCFGSESGQLEGMETISSILADPPAIYEQILRQSLREGLSFAAAQETAVKQIIRNNHPALLDNVLTVFKQPNNILGVSYLKHLKISKSNIRAHTIPRIGSGYLDREIAGEINSATGIRYHYQKNSQLELLKKSMPFTAFQEFRQSLEAERGPVFLENFEQILMLLLKRTTPAELAKLPHVTEGLENRLINCAHQTNTLPAFLECAKNKRVPYTRLQRILIHLLLQINKDMADQWYYHKKPAYARILAFNDKGRVLLRLASQHTRIPFITKTAAFEINDSSTQQLLHLDYKASRIFGMMLSCNSFRSGEPDLTFSPVYVKDSIPDC